MTEEETPWNPEHLEVVRQGTIAIDKFRLANPTVRFDLRSAGLQGVDLQRANLRGADLTEANLSGSNLKRAHLNAANLTSADLREADMTWADLSEARLQEANLTGARLGFSTLVWIEAEEADFTGTVWADVAVASDLTNARGLDRAVHRAPSHLSHRFLLESTANPWPIKFLRGIGLSEHQIEHALAIAASASAIDFYSSFISYSTKDDAFAVKLHDALQAQGVRCWLDKHEVLPGDNIYGKVNEGIRLWDKVLLLCTEDSLNSWWVKRELKTAFQKEERLEQERGHEVLAVIPLDVDGYLFSDECKMEFTEDLRGRHAAQFKGWKRKKGLFDKQLERVVKALRADAGAKKAPPTPKL